MLRAEKSKQLIDELLNANKKTAKLLRNIEYLVEYEMDAEVGLSVIKLNEEISKQYKKAGELEWLFENEINVFEEIFQPGKTSRRDYSIKGSPDNGFKIICPILPVQKYAHKGASKDIARNIERLLQEYFVKNDIAAPVYDCLCDVEFIIHMNSLCGEQIDAHNMEFKYALDAMIGFMFPDDNSSYTRIRLAGDLASSRTYTEINIKKAEN